VGQHEQARAQRQVGARRQEGGQRGDQIVHAVHYVWSVQCYDGQGKAPGAGVGAVGGEADPPKSVLSGVAAGALEAVHLGTAHVVPLDPAHGAGMPHLTVFPVVRRVHREAGEEALPKVDGAAG